MKRCLIILLTLLSAISISAQEYAMTAPIGYAAGTTGGGNATPEIVNNYNSLKSALTSDNNKVILVDGTITFPENANPINISSNKTLIGLPGAKLEVYPVAQNQRNPDGSGSGLLSIGRDVTNVVIRNLIFQGPGAWDTGDGKDLLSNQGQKIWVDHCEFYDGMDGNFDNNNRADNVTVSWCKFGYTIPTKPFVPPGGETNDHRFSNLVGGSATDRPSDGRYSITFAYNYWGEGVVQRMPRARNAQLHILNCYYNTSVGSVALGLEAGISGTDCYVEGSHFDRLNSTNPAMNRVYGKYTSNNQPYGNYDPNLTFVDSRRGASNAISGTIAGTAVSRPAYQYTALSVDDVKAAVTGSCGAGATLLVDVTGAISSPCAAQYPTINLLSANETLNQNLSQNTAIQNVVFTWGGAATGLQVTELPEGLRYETDPIAKTLTIKGTATSMGVFNYTVSTVGGEGTRNINGSIIVKSANAKRIAFVTIPNDPADVPVLNKLNNNLDFSITIINANATGVDYSGYDMILLSAVPPSNSAGLAPVQPIVNIDKPKLVLKPFQLQNTRWNWSNTGAVNPNPAQLTMTIVNKNHQIFDGLTFTGTNNDELQLFSSLVGANAVTGIVAGSWRGDTDLLGVAKGTTTQSIVEIPVGTDMNGTMINSRFLMIGLSEFSTANLTSTATQLIENACYYLMGIDIPNSINDVENDTLIIRRNDRQIIVEGVEIGSLTLFGIAGQQIMTTKEPTLITSSVNRGIYILSVRTKNGTVINRKLML